MSWVDFFNAHPYLTILAILLLQLPIIYELSQLGRFYIKMTLYYLSILVAGSFAVLSSIPTYFQNRGGIWAFRTFQTFTYWLDVFVEVRDQEKLEGEGQAVIVSNHQSSLDIVGMARCWPDRCTVMMKKSLMYVPGFNLASILCNVVFVDRYNHEKAQEALEGAAKVMKEKNIKIWVFPEGTRSHNESMLPFKKGAFNIAVRAQIPVIPVVFSSYLPFYSKQKGYFYNNGQVIAQVLDPIPTKGMTLEDVPALADRVRSIMMEEYEKISPEAASKQQHVNERCNPKKEEAPTKKSE